MNLARMLSAVFMTIAVASFILASLDKPGRFMWIVLVLVCGIAGHSIGLHLENMVMKHAKGIPLHFSELEIGKTYRRMHIDPVDPGLKVSPGTILVWIRPWGELTNSSLRICEFDAVPDWRFKLEKDDAGNKKIVNVPLALRI